MTIKIQTDENLFALATTKFNFADYIMGNFKSLDKETATIAACDMLKDILTMAERLFGIDADEVDIEYFKLESTTSGFVVCFNTNQELTLKSEGLKLPLTKEEDVIVDAKTAGLLSTFAALRKGDFFKHFERNEKTDSLFEVRSLFANSEDYYLNLGYMVQEEDVVTSVDFTEQELAEIEKQRSFIYEVLDNNFSRAEWS